MARVGQLHAEGWSHRQIAASLGVCHRTIQNDLRPLAATKVATSPEKVAKKSATKVATTEATGNVVPFARRKAG
jgi:IS30 family transposase